MDCRQTISASQRISKGLCANGATSDLCLDQVVPLCADVFEEACDVDDAFVSHLLQHAVQHDVGSRSAYARTAQQQDRRRKLEMNQA